MRRDDGWHRGFAEPDLGDEDRPPPTPRSKPGTTGFTGADDRDVITVTVDGTGVVADVGVPPNWRDWIGPRELGQALLTAANNALSGWLGDMIERTDLEPGLSTTTRADALDAGGDPSSAVARNLMAEIGELFATVDRDLAAYREQLVRAANVTAEAKGSNGRIHVTMAPGSVSAVTVDSRWATSARYTEIRAEALGAFRAAGRQLDGAGTVSVPASLARIQELASDPVALCRELGLSRPQQR
ncbi:MAG TPA: hypothetical protein VFV67_33700 [Actinophytocola sp.]|uniref:hypothetical protein n=1 Tax=Actinophytocola sp. TaxID=1872138 RepID=UPI002DBE041A|nr:hypothetical protein [Actinophytocola sp.]HEU5475624.1 hypothetical protein [Actinophytocola sp.]